MFLITAHVRMCVLCLKLAHAQVCIDCHASHLRVPVHCVTAADHTLMSSVAAKKYELSQAAAAGHGVNRHTALQSSAPKFGLCYFCILMSLVYLLSTLFCKYWCVVCS